MTNKAYTSSLTYEVSNVSLNNGYMPINNCIPAIESVEDGTIIVRFRNYPKQGFMPLFNVVNDQYPSSYLSLYIEHAQKIGFVKHIISEDKINTKHLDIHKTIVIDPKFIHTAALKAVKGEGYKLFLNGELLCQVEDEHASLFSDLCHSGSISNAILGEFFESQKIADKHYPFSGHFDFLHIHESALSDEMLCTVTGHTAHPEAYKLEHHHVFYPGLGGSSNFRIPALLTTSSGTLIASVDQREFGHQDHSNRIKTIIRRSSDSGKTFGPPITACKMFGRGQTIDACLVEDQVNSRLFLLNNSHPECLSSFTPMSGSGFTEIEGKQYYILTSNDDTYFGDMEGNIYDSHLKPTDYSFDSHFNLMCQDSLISNLFNSDSPIKVHQTSYTLLCFSDDDGLTWSEPKILNQAIKEPYMTGLNVAPGIGIQVKKGAHKDRICFPIYFYNTYGGGSSAILYSDDYGATFTLGESANHHRVFNGQILNQETCSATNTYLTECQIVEMPNGYLKLFMRNTNGCTAVATSRDGGASFDNNVILDQALTDPYCQSSVLGLLEKVDGKDAIAFCHPSATSRTDGTVRIGLLEYDDSADDYTITWPYAYKIKAGSFAYSCMAQTTGDTLSIIYEGTPSTYISLSTTSIDQLKETPTINNHLCNVSLTSDALILSFDECVMLSGDRALIVTNSNTQETLPLVQNDILNNECIFTKPASLELNDVSLSFSPDTDILDRMGEPIDINWKLDWM